MPIRVIRGKNSLGCDPAVDFHPALSVRRHQSRRPRVTRTPSTADHSSNVTTFWPQSSARAAVSRGTEAMSAISALQTTSLQQILQQQSASLSKAGSTGSVSSPSSQRESLDSILESSGLSADDQASLKSDLKSALDDVFTSSSSFPPNPEDVQSAVKSVFSKYGLDAEQLSSKLAPPEGGDLREAAVFPAACRAWAAPLPAQPVNRPIPHPQTRRPATPLPVHPAAATPRPLCSMC